MMEEQKNTAVSTITLQDLALMINIIDVSVKRGGVEGGEMALVGNLREKLSNFVKANMPEESEEAEAESE